MAHFPLLGSARSSRDGAAAAGEGARGRRFSFSKAKSRVEHSASTSAAAPPLKRSRSARSSLIASARRLSSAATRRGKGADDPPSTVATARSVLADRNDRHEARDGLRSYSERAAAFAMSSPELATPGEERDAPWPAWDEAARTQAGEAVLPPHSPMVRWAADHDGHPSFMPLSPTSMRPFSDSSSSLPSGHISEESAATSLGLDTSEPSSAAVQPAPVLLFARARSPRTKWSTPVIPPAPVSPDLPVERSMSRSPPADDATCEACRAEALARLTSPTPTQSRFDDLSAFPFPNMPASSPPPAPTRPLPFLPDVTLPAASSASLILPRSPASEEPGSPPLLVRSNTVGLHPAPVPLDIDFKGRLVRARNSQPVPSSSTSSPSLTLSSSPGSSCFSDWHPPAGSRKSSDTSVTFSKQDHDDPLRLPQPPKASGGLYALAASDRRGVESAVDVLAIVEEDEALFTGAPALRAKRSPSKRGPGDSPRRRFSAGSAGTKKPSSPLASELAEESAILVVPRTRARAPLAGEAAPSIPTGKPTYPFRLSTADRSFSAGAALEPTSSERDELGLHQPLRQPSFAALTPPRAGPRAGKRCLSELERPSASRERDDAYGLVGLGLPSSLGDSAAAGRRTRHESFAAREGDEEGIVAAHGEYRQRRASRRVSSGTATRTKLVLREKGKPVLTYQLGECIGRGQFGSVYRALNLNTGQVVAVKRILLEGKTDAEVDQLSNEVALLQRLSHPSVVKYEGVVRTEHYLNIILEYVENGSLSAILKQFGQLPEGLVASYAVKILEGLAYLHQQNVVHCDLKAANLLSTKNGNIKLSDFGVSLNLNAIKATRGFNATSNEANGTPNWMAPEVISLKGALPASDIWSLAATIVELIDGRPPYSDLVAMSAMFRIVEDPAGPPIPDRCSPELKRFLARCFKKNPNERPTADELFEDPWLLKHFDFPQDMRPQDSLPFLRRISTEYRRAPLVPSFSPAEAVVELPLPLEPPVPPFAAKEEPRGRPSFDSGYSGSDERGLSPEPSAAIHATEETHRPHAFIRSSFSKAIDCKVCGESTKRHAVLCTSCGLISHARCKEFAPVCDLRTQLFGPSASSAQPLPPFARFPTMPSSTSSSPSSFAISDLLPFSKARRAKSPTPTSSETHLPLQTVAHRTSSAGEAIRQLSHALLPSKSRTPDSTPPSSLGRTAPAPPTVASSPLKGRPHSLSVSVAVPRSGKATSAMPAIPPTSPVSASPKDPHSIDLRAARHVSMDTATAANVGVPLQRRSSRCNVVVQPGGTRALGRKKSHGRSVSQPVVGLKNAVSDTDNSRVHGEAGLPAKGECVVM